ncbi:MAG: VOC family protein, partial [Brevibacterium aurantiacum]
MTVTENTTASATASPVVNDTLLSAATGMDAVTLRVGDLEKMSTYYSNALAMEPLEEVERGNEIHRVLGRGTTPLV